MKLFFPFLLGLFLLSITKINAQQQFDNTIIYEDSIASPKSSIEDVAWIAGHWIGEAFGGIIEEVWTPPLGNSMMGMFKMVEEEKVNFYEIEMISEEDNTLVFKLKHFHADLRGWEEKDEYTEAKLVKLEKNKAYFNGFTFERVDEDHLNIYVVIEEKGKHSEMKFSYQLLKNSMAKKEK